MKAQLTLQGSSILEVLIATALISLSILAALSLNNNSQKTTSYARDLSAATNYNNQAIDWLRHLRSDMGWGEFTTSISADNGGNPTYCLDSLPSDSAGFTALTHGNCSANDYLTDTKLIREAEINYLPGSDSLSVTVTTSWENNTHSTSTEATITNW